jgi:hypothetical protein
MCTWRLPHGKSNASATWVEITILYFYYGQIDGKSFAGLARKRTIFNSTVRVIKNMTLTDKHKANC